MKYQIIIEIDEESNVRLETKGFKGPSCEKEIKNITKDIVEIKTTQKTKEYYEKAKQKIKKKISSFSN